MTSSDASPHLRRCRRAIRIALFLPLAAGCSMDQPEGTGPRVSILHLEEAIATAEVDGAQVPAGLAEPVVWSFGDGSNGWRALPTVVPGGQPARIAQSDAGLLVSLDEGAVSPDPNEYSSLHGGIFLQVPEWDLDGWSHVLIEARTADPVSYLDVGYAVRRQAGEGADEMWPLLRFAAGTIIITDGEWQTYRLQATPEEEDEKEGTTDPEREEDSPVREIGLEIDAFEPVSLEIRSITWVPKDALYADSGLGVRSIAAGAGTEVPFGPRRRTLFAHTPVRIAYRLRVPPGGRLDLGLGAHRSDIRFSVEVDGGQAAATLLEQTVPAAGAWRQRSVDLSEWAGEDVTLTLAAESTEGPAVAQ